MKNLKSWEKRLLNSVYEFFFHLKISISNGWKKFIKKGNEKLTIMMIPHNQKKIFNIHISLFVLAFFIVMLSFVVMFVFFSMTTFAKTKEQLRTKISQYDMVSSEYQEYKGKLDNHVNGAYSNFLEMGKALNDLSSYYKADLYDEVYSSNVGGPEEGTPDNMLSLQTKIESMNESFADITNIFREILDSKESNEKLSREIPTRSPIISGAPYRISSYFGIRRDPFSGLARTHLGLDLAATSGTPLVATADGHVTYAGIKGGYGYVVIIEHSYGFKTVYGHMRLIQVVKGQKVKKGQRIGLLGQSGRATGPHVHYEVRINYSRKNPLGFIHLYLGNI